MVTGSRDEPGPAGALRSRNHPMGYHRGQLPPSRCQPLPVPATRGQADGLIRLSGRIPAGGDTQSIIMSPGQRQSPEHPGKAGCPPPRSRPPRPVTRNRKASDLKR